MVGLCPQLYSLNLESNAICKIPNYRPIVVSYIPQLQVLDDKAITSTDKIQVKYKCLYVVFGFAV